jgi:Ca-activated chloride channel family protein
MKRFILTVILALFVSGLIWGGGAQEGIGKGNSAYKEGKFDKALSYYDEAKVKDPESPYIYFNKGSAYFRMEDFDKAKEAFRNAATKTKDIKLEAKANYNLGLCSFAEAGKQGESDLKKALEQYQESIAYFSRALEDDPGLKDAATNLEIARVMVKDLLDKIKKDQEKNKDKTDKQKEIAEKIAKLIERENTIMDYTTTMSEEKDKSGISQTLSASINKLKGEQTKVRTDTGSVASELADLAKSMGGNQAQSPVVKAGEHVRNSSNYQQLAESKLGAQDLKNSLESETGGRDELVKALEALSGQQNPQNQQNKDDQKKNEQKEEEKKAQAARAKDILDEEKENNKMRQQAQAGYSAPDKDW